MNLQNWILELRSNHETATDCISSPPHGAPHAVRTPVTANPSCFGCAPQFRAIPLLPGTLSPLAAPPRPLAPAPRAPGMCQRDCRTSASPSTPARSKSTSPGCAFASCRSRAAYKTSLRAPHAPRHPFPHPPHAIANGEQSSPWRRLLCPHIAQIGHPASFSSSP